mmetsp:Transcript_98562/g.169555  ORF Transcript_98562/g.169555 Transcript_98562/m.169555 type:complete len:132 (-) Transcript_98562:82-477(-)
MRWMHDARFPGFVPAAHLKRILCMVQTAPTSRRRQQKLQMYDENNAGILPARFSLKLCTRSHARSKRWRAMSVQFDLHAMKYFIEVVLAVPLPRRVRAAQAVLSLLLILVHSLVGQVQVHLFLEVVKVAVL